MFNLIVEIEGQEPTRYDFDQEEVTIGRLSSSDIPIKTTNVSKQHCRIVFREGKYYIIDRKSTNGTYLNGKRITTPQALKHGDKLFMGDTGMTFLLPDAAIRPKSDSGSFAAVKNGAPVAPMVMEDEQSLKRTVQMKAITPEEAAQTQPPAIPEDMAQTQPPAIPEEMAQTDVPTMTLPAAKAEPDNEPKSEKSAAALKKTPTPAALGTQEFEEFKGRLPQWRYAIFTQAMQNKTIQEMESPYEYKLDDEAFVKKFTPALKTIISKVLGKDGSKEVRAHLETLLLEELLGYGPLERFVYDEENEQIFVNGTQSILVTRLDGKQVIEESFSCQEAVTHVVGRILHFNGLDFDPSQGFVEARLADGDTITAMFAPYSSKGTTVRISRCVHVPTDLDDLVEKSWISSDMSQQLKTAVAEGRNILICGEHERDRTQLLLALSKELSDHERIAIINGNDSFPLTQPDVFHLEAITQDSDHALSQLSTGDLIHAAMRLGSTRLVVNQLGEEGVDELLFALGAAMPRVFFGAWGRDPQDSLSRLELMVGGLGGDDERKGLRQTLSESIDLVVTLRRYANGERRVVAISEANLENNRYQFPNLFVFQDAGTGDSPKGKFKKVR